MYVCIYIYLRIQDTNKRETEITKGGGCMIPPSYETFKHPHVQTFYLFCTRTHMRAHTHSHTKATQ